MKRNHVWMRHSALCGLLLSLGSGVAIAQDTPPATAPAETTSEQATDDPGVATPIVETSAEVPPTAPVVPAEPIPLPPPALDPPPTAEGPAAGSPEDGAETEEDDTPFPLDVTASVFTRPEVRSGYDNLGRADTDFVRYRFRVGLVLRPIEVRSLEIGARFVPQAAGFWASGARLEDPALGIHEAVLTLKHGRLGFEIGRFEMAYGEHVVIGNVGWHQVGRAFDGIRMRTALSDNAPADGGAYLDLFATQLNEGLDTDFGNGDTYFFGAYAGLGGFLGDALTLDVYLLSRLDSETDATPRTHVSTLGSRFKFASGIFDARVEAGGQLQGGDDVDTRFAYQADAEFGVRLGPARLALEGLIASGPSGDSIGGYNHLFPTAHKFLGLADIIGARTNIGSGVLHAQLKINDAWSARLDAHIFLRPENTAPAGDNSGYVGFETDVGARWLIVPGLALRANYSLFVPSEDAFGVNDVAHFGELELRYTR